MNKNGEWIYQNKTWLIPSESDVGYLEEKSDILPHQVLGLMNGEWDQCRDHFIRVTFSLVSRNAY